MDITKDMFEEAHLQSGMEDDIRWDATDAIRGVYSRSCPAVIGSDNQFLKFFGSLLVQAQENGEEIMQSDVDWLADRVVTDTMADDTIFGFAGLELT